MLLAAGYANAAKVNAGPVEQASASLLRSRSWAESEERYLRVHRHEDGTAELQVLQPIQPANLSKAYLVDADLTGANLEGVTAKEAHLYGEKTKLKGALMSLIRLVSANLGTADLQGAQLRGATLSDANLVGAKLMNADFTPYGDLSADLSGTYLSGANFTDAKLNGTELTDAAVSTSKGIHLFTLNAEARAELAAGRSFLLGASSFDNYLKALTKPDKALLKELLDEEPADKRVEITSGVTITAGGQDATEWKIVTSGAQPTTLLVTLDKETRPTSIVMVLSVKAEGSAEKKPLPDGFLPSYIMALNTSQPAILEPAFNKLGFPLGVNPSITVSKRIPAAWKVTDPANRVELMFWTRAFDLGVRGMRVQSPFTALRGLFTRNQQALIERAEISATAVDNDWGNTAALTPGYVQFNLLEGEVYGTQLRITRLGANDRLEAAVIPMNQPTVLPSSAMDSNTRWPNGKTTTKQDPKEPAETWLWSSTLPTPPHCVPSMHGYCPPET
jgi:Pentapeptide repeats (8 copies)